MNKKGFAAPIIILGEVNNIASNLTLQLVPGNIVN